MTGRPLRAPGVLDTFQKTKPTVTTIKRRTSLRALVGYFRATNPKNLLAPPLRRGVLDHLTKHGPSTPGGMARVLGTSFPRIRYHATILERAGVVSSLRTGPHTYYFLAGRGSARDVEVALALRRSRSRAIVAELRERPGSGADLGQRLGLPASAVVRALRRLETAGIVSRGGKDWFLRPEGDGASAAVAHEPSRVGSRPGPWTTT